MTSRITTYNAPGRFASVLLQFCLRIQKQFWNKTIPGNKNTYRGLRRRIPEDVYFQAILKWAKSEGQQRAEKKPSICSKDG